MLRRVGEPWPISPPDQTADVPGDRDERHPEGDDQVDHNIGTSDRTLRSSLRSTKKSTPNRPKIAVEAPALGDGRREDVGRDVAAEPAHEVDGEEAHRAEHRLQRPAEHPQRPHVQREVQQAVVHEHRR